MLDDTPPVILVDSSETLANEPGNTAEDRVYKAYGEWNTDDNYEGWVVSGADSASVSGGNLTATENLGGDPLKINLDIPTQSRAILCLGFNDFLLLRCRISSDYRGDMEFCYRTSFETSLSDTKVFKIPSGTLARDGGFHTYLVDLKLERRWRGDLYGLEIIPFSTSTPSGRSVVIDYFRIGDVASDVVGLNTDVNFYTGETLQDCSNIQSKHAVIWWSPHTDVLYQAAYGPFASLTLRNRTCLRILEETYAFTTKALGYAEPLVDMDGSTPGRFKFPITTWWEGGWMSSYNGFPYNNFGPCDEKDAAGNPIRHEYGHGVQAAMPAYHNGRHWESHDGYMHTEQMLYWGEIQDTDMAIPGFMTWVNTVPGTQHMSSLPFESRHFAYADRRPYWYLDTDPDNLGIGAPLVVKMWTNGVRDQYFPTSLLNELPVGVAYQDVTLGWSRRWKFFDKTGGEDKRTWYFNNPDRPQEEKLQFRQEHMMMPVPCPDKSGWYRCTSGTAPQVMGYSAYELTATPGATVTVNLRMLDIPGSAEGLRWCLAASSEGVTSPQIMRYSAMWPGNESHSFTMGPAEDNLYLIVAGTPYPIPYDLTPEENAKNIDKDPSAQRYHFEVGFTNTAPKVGGTDLYCRTIGSGHAHSNGGGFVENTATVASTAYVGPNARVLGTANVSGYAVIDGYATVINAVVKDYAQVTGRSLVQGGGCRVEGNARIRDRSHVRGGADVSDNALLCDHAKWIAGHLFENAVVRGLAWTYGNPNVQGTAILDGDYVAEWSLNDGIHKGHLPWDGFTYYWEDYRAYLQKARGLVAAYHVEESEGELLWDTFGAVHGLIRGAPTRVYDSQMCANVLQLNGSDGSVLLDSSIGDSKEFSFGGWVNLTSRTAGAALLSLGHRSDEYIRLVPSNSLSLVELTVRSRSGSSVTLTSSSSIPTGQWVHLACTMNGSAICLYVNGAQVDTDTFSFYPYQMITPDLQQTGQANYVGRDWSGNYLNAAVTGLEFYNMAMTSAEVTASYNRYGSMLGRFYKDTTYTSGTKVNTGISSTPEGTIMVDVYATEVGDVTSYRAIVDSWNYVSGHYLEFQYGRGMPSLGVDNGKYIVMLQNAGRWNTNVTCPTSTWQTVALTYTETQAKIYINGVQQASTNAAQKYPGGAVYNVGGSTNSAVSAFSGNLKNIRIFDKALEQQEVEWLSLYENPATPRTTFTPLPPTQTPTPTTTPAPPSVRSYYRFEVDASDSLGNYHGTLINHASIVSDTERANVLNLDGTDDYVTLPQGVVNYSDITLALWIKWNGGGSWQRWYDFGNDTSRYMFLTSTSSNLRFAIKNGGNEQQLNTSAIATGVWRHVVVTIIGNTGKMYVGGQLVATNTNMTVNPSDFNPSLNYVGKSQYADPYLKGRVDDFRIFNYGLDDGEIYALYSGQPTPTLTSTNTPTRTPTVTDTPTATNTATITNTRPTNTPSSTPTPADTPGSVAYDAVGDWVFDKDDNTGLTVLDGANVTDGALQNVSIYKPAEDPTYLGHNISGSPRWKTYSPAGEGISGDGYALNTTSGYPYWSDNGSAAESVFRTNNTFSAWARVKRTAVSTDAYQSILSRPNNWRLAVKKSTGTVVAVFGGTEVDTGTAFNVGEWHDVGFSYSGSGYGNGTLTIYIDGLPAGSFTPGAFGTGDVFHVGDGPGGAESFIGWYDRVLFWDVVKDASVFADLATGPANVDSWILY